MDGLTAPPSTSAISNVLDDVEYHETAGRDEEAARFTELLGWVEKAMREASSE